MKDISSKECLSCMECCRWVGLVLSPINGDSVDDLVQMYQWRGAEIKEITPDGRVFLIVPSKCSHVTKFGCDIYHTRPGWCRRYDGRTDPAMKDKCKLTYMK